ncbi:hypothetical protein X777_02151, partial [Ooceraea biroi]
KTHVESVLSAYLEREQGQSGAHIRRPYTGAEKVFFPNTLSAFNLLKTFSYKHICNTNLFDLKLQDLKKRDSHICDMQALQPLPAPTNTANIAPAMTTSGGQPPLPVSETV